MDNSFHNLSIVQSHHFPIRWCVCVCARVRVNEKRFPFSKHLPTRSVKQRKLFIKMHGECFKMGCKKVPTSPLPKDTTGSHLHAERFPLKKPWQPDEQTLWDRGDTAASGKSGWGDVVSATTTPPRHGDPQMKVFSKVKHFPPGARGVCVPHQAPQPLDPAQERWGPEMPGFENLLQQSSSRKRICD